LLEAYALQWERFHELAAQGQAIPVPLVTISELTPLVFARKLATVLDVPSPSPPISATWRELDALGVQYDMSGDAARSNVPNMERMKAGYDLDERIHEYFRNRLGRWNDLYECAFERSKAYGL